MLMTPVLSFHEYCDIFVEHIPFKLFHCLNSIIRKRKSNHCTNPCAFHKSRVLVLYNYSRTLGIYMYIKSTIVTEFMLSTETIRTNNLQLHEQCFGDYQTFICMSAFF